MTDEAEVFNEVRDVSEIGHRHYETTSERQLSLARFAMHRVRLAQYNNAMRAGMSEEEAQHHYTEAMRNYDGILSDELLAPNAGRYEAAKRDLAEGWRVL